jgi:HEAT repeat protein
LGGTEPIASGAVLTEAGVDADGALLETIARDRQVSRYLRMRAASALGFFESTKGRAALTRVAEAVDDEEVQLQAMATLAYVAGARALPVLERVLAAASPTLRAGAVRGLARVGGPAAAQLIEQRRALEADPRVRRELDRASLLRRE